MTKKGEKAFLPLLIVFILVNVLLFIPLSLDALWNMDRDVMLVGNLILFAATMISFNLYRRALIKNNAHAFIRMIYGGMFAKMMICLFAAVIYIMIAKKDVSKGAVFGLMFLYFVYTFVEISIIMKLSRKEKYVKDRSAA